ncbi:MAG: RNA methyltransferase [Bacillota bacterium]|nr:RNA methyltransferase [Bacillota bacterium]
MKEITSTANPLVKMWRQLNTASGRKAHGLFLAEGEHLCQEAVKEGRTQTLLVDKTRASDYSAFLDAGIDTILVSPQVLSALADSKTPQGLIAVCPVLEELPLAEAGPRLVALNRLQDPGNVGTILRTLDAAGFNGLILDQGCADPYSPKVVRAGMGAVFRVPVYRCLDLADALKSLPHTLIAGDLKGGPFYQHPPFEGKICILIGNEGQGLDEDVLNLAHMKLRLPILGGAESLNAAVAAGLFIYEAVREDTRA